MDSRVCCSRSWLKEMETRKAAERMRGGRTVLLEAMQCVFLPVPKLEGCYCPFRYRFKSRTRKCEDDYGSYCSARKAERSTENLQITLIPFGYYCTLHQTCHESCYPATLFDASVLKLCNSHRSIVITRAER